MPRWVKVMLAVFGVLALVCVVSAGGFAAWLNANKDRLKVEGDTAKAEGMAYGKSADAQACLGEGLRRLDLDRGIVKQALNNIFVEECLRLAVPRSEGFCVGVPSRDEVVATATWTVTQCQQRQRGDDKDCARMMQVVQKVCP